MQANFSRERFFGPPSHTGEGGGGGNPVTAQGLSFFNLIGVET